MSNQNQINYIGALLITAMAIMLLWTSHTALTSLQKQDEPSAIPLTIPPLPEPQHDLAYYDPITDRPIFVADRQPRKSQIQNLVTDGDAENANSSVTLPFSLIGIIINGDNKAAIFKSVHEPEALSLHIGQNLDNWIVKEIQSDTVSVESAGSRQTLRLEDDIKK